MRLFINGVELCNDSLFSLVRNYSYSKRDFVSGFRDWSPLHSAWLYGNSRTISIRLDQCTGPGKLWNVMCD